MPTMEEYRRAGRRAIEAGDYEAAKRIGEAARGVFAGVKPKIDQYNDAVQRKDWGAASKLHDEIAAVDPDRMKAARNEKVTGWDYLVDKVVGGGKRTDGGPGLSWQDFGDMSSGAVQNLAAVPRGIAKGVAGDFGDELAQSIPGYGDYTKDAEVGKVGGEIISYALGPGALTKPIVRAGAQGLAKETGNQVQQMIEGERDPLAFDPLALAGHSAAEAALGAAGKVVGDFVAPRIASVGTHVAAGLGDEAAKATVAGWQTLPPQVVRDIAKRTGEAPDTIIAAAKRFEDANGVAPSLAELASSETIAKYGKIAKDSPAAKRVFVEAEDAANVARPAEMSAAVARTGQTATTEESKAATRNLAAALPRKFSKFSENIEGDLSGWMDDVMRGPQGLADEVVSLDPRMVDDWLAGMAGQDASAVEQALYSTAAGGVLRPDTARRVQQSVAASHALPEARKALETARASGTPRRVQQLETAIANLERTAQPVSISVGEVENLRRGVGKLGEPGASGDTMRQKIIQSLASQNDNYRQALVKYGESANAITAMQKAFKDLRGGAALDAEMTRQAPVLLRNMGDRGNAVIARLVRPLEEFGDVPGRVARGKVAERAASGAGAARAVAQALKTGDLAERVAARTGDAATGRTLRAIGETQSRAIENLKYLRQQGKEISKSAFERAVASGVFGLVVHSPALAARALVTMGRSVGIGRLSKDNARRIAEAIVNRDPVVMNRVIKEISNNEAQYRKIARYVRAAVMSLVTVDE